MKSDIVDLVTELGITKIGFEKDGKYYIQFDNSNDYQEVFELLESSEKLETIEDSVEFNEDINKISFKYQDIVFDLVANFEDEVYELFVYEV